MAQFIVKLSRNTSVHDSTWIDIEAENIDNAIEIAKENIMKMTVEDIGELIWSEDDDESISYAPVTVAYVILNDETHSDEIIETA